MGKADVVTKKYMGQNHIFADAFNYLIYGGKIMIHEQELREVDATEMVLPYVKSDFEGEKLRNKSEYDFEAVQKYRDILKRAVIKQDGNACYILLGIENQTDIHYAMPVRNAIYDALQYGKQVSKAAAMHNRRKKLHGRGEFLSGFKKTDRLMPVITLVIHFGVKPWDGPLSLHEMMDISDPAIKNLVSDYQVHLIDPARMIPKELEKFSSSLKEVLGYIKYSGDKEQLSAFIRRNQKIEIEQEALLVIKTITKTPLKVPEQEEKIDMCKAIDDMIKENMEIGRMEGRAEGMAVGETRGRYQGEIVAFSKLIRAGKLTIREAADMTGMTEKVFLREMEKIENYSSPQIQPLLSTPH